MATESAVASKLQARIAAVAASESGEPPPAAVETTTTDEASAPRKNVIGSKVRARIAALERADSGEPLTVAVEGVAEAPEPTSIAEALGEIPAVDPEADIKAARLKLFGEKLAQTREARRAAKIAEQALSIRQKATEEAKAAADERAALAEGRKDFKKFFEANGMNAREAYEEMTRQAIEADTPEAQLKAMQADFKRQLEDTVAPLRAQLEEAKRREAEFTAHQQQQAVAGAFQKFAADPAYNDVRVEYGDERIFEKVSEMVQDPEFFYANAETYGVPTTGPDGRFTMRDALNLIKAVYDTDNAGREQRRTRLAPRDESSADTQSAQQPSTVDGTAARRNAGTTIPNDLATGRASAGGTRLTRKERIDAEIRRTDRR
jgi:hypothetical protein